MNWLIDFFTNTLSGTTYIIVSIISIILMLYLIGFLNDYNKRYQESLNKTTTKKNSQDDEVI